MANPSDLSSSLGSPDPGGHLYSGDEPGFPLPSASARSLGEGVCYVRPPNVPYVAVPIYDESVGAVVGYVWESGGVTQIFDVEGRMVHIEELGLQTPLFDPIDLIFFFGAGYKLLGSLFRGGARAVGRMGAAGAVGMGSYLTARTLGIGVRNSLTFAFRNLTSQPLLFTATTVARMSTSSRHVPVHILQMAIRHGIRRVDPQKAKHAFEYTIPMLKQAVSGGQTVFRQYTLKVVVRESDWTVLHFVYMAK